MENKLYRAVPVTESLEGKHVCLSSSGDMFYGELFLDNSSLKWVCEDDNYLNGEQYPYVTHVLEEITSKEQLEPILGAIAEEYYKTLPEQGNLVSNILNNAIRFLDQDQARYLVKELTERFELLPTPWQISNKARIGKSLTVNTDFIKGADFVVEKLKGES